MAHILLLGKNGQVGWELQRALAPLGRVTACGHAECDLADSGLLRSVVRDTRPDAIVNAAAYTAVDRAEAEPAQAEAINAVAPAVLAEEAQRLGAWLVHYSTDYVFDGAKRAPYGEDDRPNPLNVYGSSKLAGERAIATAAGRHLIFRTSWVFAARGGNFAKAILRLAGERDALKVVADQHGAPTSAELIADVTAHCLRDVLRTPDDRRRGLYHLAAAGETSWHGYAKHILTLAAAAGVALKCAPEAVAPIASDEYPLPAKRPANSRLDTGKLRQSFAIHLPDWTFHVGRMMAETL